MQNFQKWVGEPSPDSFERNESYLQNFQKWVGEPSPDSSENGFHHNIEFDYSAKHSAKHKRTIESNDGKSENSFTILKRNHDK